MIGFKGTHFPKDIILYAVFFYVRYAVSYRDLEEILEERGVKVDHSTHNRRVIRYSSYLALVAKKPKRTVATSWRIEAAATAFFNKQSTLTDFLKKPSWIKAAPTMPGWRILTSC